MLPFRSEIRNSPKEQTIKIYLSDTEMDREIKDLLLVMDEIRLIEIQNSIARNRVGENVTVYRNEGVDINELKTKMDNLLKAYFRKNEKSPA